MVRVARRRLASSFVLGGVLRLLVLAVLWLVAVLGALLLLLRHRVCSPSLTNFLSIFPSSQSLPMLSVSRMSKCVTNNLQAQSQVDQLPLRRLLPLFQLRALPSVLCSNISQAESREMERIRRIEKSSSNWSKRTRCTARRINCCDQKGRKLSRRSVSIKYEGSVEMALFKIVIDGRTAIIFISGGCS